MTQANEPPQVDLFTRNGFAGPASTIVRSTYTPTYTRVEGAYRPQRFERWDRLDEGGGLDERALPTPILRSPQLTISMWKRDRATPFALRDVYHDQLLYVLDGTARLETDFGFLDLQPLDMVVIARGVSYRLAEAQTLRTVVVQSANPMQIDPENFAVLNLGLDVEVPRPYEARSEPGEYELVVLHGDGTTSYFYDYDPLSMLAAGGAPAVQRFNMAKVSPLTVAGATAPPARLIVDPTTTSLVFYLGSRDNGRPPVHHNVDYDEIAIYSHGPDSFGLMKVPGTIVWVPKGIIHQGPEEAAPEGFIAWLLETRAHLSLTDHGAKVAQLMETKLFGPHPTA